MRTHRNVEIHIVAGPNHKYEPYHLVNDFPKPISLSFHKYVYTIILNDRKLLFLRRSILMIIRHLYSERLFLFFVNLFSFIIELRMKEPFDMGLEITFDEVADNNVTFSFDLSN